MSYVPSDNIPVPSQETKDGFQCAMIEVKEPRNKISETKPTVSLPDYGELPEEVLLHMMTFLDCASLSVATGVSRMFRLLSDTATLWRDAYLSKYKLSHSDIKYSLVNDWKTILLKRERLEHNWRRCRAVELESEGHSKAVVCVALNQTTAVTGSHDKLLGVWEAESGSCRHVLGGHASWIRCVQSDDWKAVSGSSDRQIRIWNLHNGQCVHRLSAHDGSVWCLEYDDTTLVSGAADQTVRVWDLHTGAVLRTLIDHTGPVSSVKILGGHLIASGGSDRLVKIWDRRAAPEEALVATLEAHSQRVDSMFANRDHRLVSASKAEVRVWDLRNYASSAVGIASPLTAIHVHNDRIATGHADRVVRVWDARTGALAHSLHGHADAISCLQMDGHKIVSGGKDSVVRIWDPDTGAEINRLSCAARGHPTCLAFNKSKLVLGTSAGHVLLYDFSLSPLALLGEEVELSCPALTSCFPAAPCRHGAARPSKRPPRRRSILV